MSRVVLVTGANGQLGSCVRDRGGDTYIYTDVTELDITNLEAVRTYVSENKVEVIVNCAAYTNVDKAEDDEAIAELINCTAVENLAIVAHERGALLIHISTDYVFSGEGFIPCTEDMVTSPLGVYGRTKLRGEEAILRTGCRSIILRTSWLYSEYGGNFVKTMQRLTSERDNLTVVFDQVGTPTYAGDLADFICGVIKRDDLDDLTGVYHFSNEGVCSWYDFAIEISRMSGNNCKITPCHSSEFPSRVKRPHYSVLDKSKLKSRFGVEIPYWRDSLELCITKLA